MPDADLCAPILLPAASALSESPLIQCRNGSQVPASREAFDDNFYEQIPTADYMEQRITDTISGTGNQCAGGTIAARCC